MWLCVVGSGDAATYRACVCLLSVFVLTDIVQITTSDVVLDCHATGWKDKVGHVGGRKRPY